MEEIEEKDDENIKSVNNTANVNQHINNTVEGMEESHPRDMSLYRKHNIFKTLTNIFLWCDYKTNERENYNHSRLDQYLQYKNGALYDKQDEINKSSSQQNQISLFYEKLKKTTEDSLDSFEKGEIIVKD